jgi:hypothetical protein
MGEAKRRRDAGGYPDTSTPPPPRVRARMDAATAPSAETETEAEAAVRAWIEAGPDPDISRGMHFLLNRGGVHGVRAALLELGDWYLQAEAEDDDDERREGEAAEEEGT